MKRKLFEFGLCFVLAIIVCVSFSSFAFAKKSKPVVLNFNHLFPEVSWMHQNVVVPWKQMVEEKSQGKIKVNLYPAGALAKPGTMYDAVKTGTIDICLDPGPYYWGRFPMSEATQQIRLPTVPDRAYDVFGSPLATGETLDLTVSPVYLVWE